MKQILTLILVTFSLGVFADDYNYLIVEQTDKVAHDIALTALRKITFEGGNVVVHTLDNQKTEVPLVNLSRLYFSAEGTGVESVTGDGGKRVVAIYSLDGRRMTGSEVDMLPGGVYILRRVDGTSIKIARK